MGIDLDRYDGRYVSLALSSGHLFAGELMISSDSLAPTSSKKYILRGEVNTSGCMDVTERYLSGIRRYWNLEEYEIAPDHVTIIIRY